MATGAPAVAVCIATPLVIASEKKRSKKGEGVREVSRSSKGAQAVRMQGAGKRQGTERRQSESHVDRSEQKAVKEAFFSVHKEERRREGEKKERRREKNTTFLQKEKKTEQKNNEERNSDDAQMSAKKRMERKMKLYSPLQLATTAA